MTATPPELEINYRTASTSLKIHKRDTHLGITDPKVCVLAGGGSC